MTKIKTPKIILDKDGAELKCKFSSYASDSSTVFEVSKQSTSGKVMYTAFVNQKDIDFEQKIPTAKKQIFSNKTTQEIVKEKLKRDAEKAETKKSSRASTAKSKTSGSKSTGNKTSSSDKTSKRTKAMLDMFN